MFWNILGCPTVTTLLGVGTETPGDCTDDTLPGDPVIDMSSRSDTKLRGDIGCWLLRRGRLKHVNVNVSYSRLKLSVTVEWIISGHFLIYTCMYVNTYTHMQVKIRKSVLWREHIHMGT